MGLRAWLGLEDLEEQLSGIEARLTTVKTAERRPYDDEPVWKALEELSGRLDEMRHAVAEGIERVDRSERRIKQTVRRAREKLEAAGYTDDGLEAEAQQLQLLDGQGGGGGRMPDMQQAMEAYRPNLQAFPGHWGDSEVAAVLRARG